jgi:3-oxoadipate enol-lactonase
MATLSADGVDLYYKEAGKGPPLLLIHGSGLDADGWGPVFDDLAQDHRVIAYDRRGFSRSRHDPIADWRRHADDAASLIEALELAPAAVVGWSAGGIVAVDLAVHDPQLVGALVLCEPVLHGRKHVRPRDALAFVGAQVRRRLKGDRRAAEAFYRWVLSYPDGGSSWDSPKADPERLEAMLDNATACLTEQQATDKHLTPERVSGISCPVTCILGARTQPLFERTTRAAAERIPGAELRVIERSNHAFVTEAPQELAAAIREGAAGRIR